MTNFQIGVLCGIFLTIFVYLIFLAGAEKGMRYCADFPSSPECHEHGGNHEN